MPFDPITLVTKPRSMCRTDAGVVGLLFWFLASGLSIPAFAVWNNPYPAKDARDNVFYTSFSERPKYMDPVRSYSSNEYEFIAQIYEPPLQYHFLRRPYTLVPLTAQDLPTVKYLDKSGKELAENTPVEQIAFSEYTITLKPGIRFQPHPALAKDSNAEYLYHDLKAGQIEKVNTLKDFPITGTRELLAADYVYQIKRIANPRLHSPIAGVMREYIVGFEDFTNQVKKAYKDRDIKPNQETFLDLRQLPMQGLVILGRYQYRIRIRGKYPQFQYWLAMPFFAPMPWEAEKFYQQSGMKKKNISLHWYPIGTGPFMLAENNPNLRMVLERNPNFHGENYPAEGDPEDEKNGLLLDARRALPFIDRAVFNLEKESIPYWNKFLQGYYDASGISSDSFDQAISFGLQGDAQLTPRIQKQGVSLVTAVTTSIYYMGFNMRDPVLGGDGERARLLRQAISIAMDFEEYISIFQNGRGIAAQGPIPPGIFGHRSGKEGINPYVYAWRDGQSVRRPVERARELLRKAQYADGIDQTTGKPLVLYFDTTSSGPGDKARLDWMLKQMKKLGIQLVIRATDYNRFQGKMLKGTSQIFMWGWNADYPDPENFLFLLYGPNSKVGKNGENAANYQNKEFDELFARMKNMENSPERQIIIDQMLDILRRDAPWVWGFHPKAFSLFHSWVYNVKPNLMANNILKYKRVDPVLRAGKRIEWNQPILWPIWVLGALLLITLIPALLSYRRRERSTAL